MDSWYSSCIYEDLGLSSFSSALLCKTLLKTALCAADWRFSGCGDLLMCLWLMLEVLSEIHWVQDSLQPASHFITEGLLEDRRVSSVICFVVS